MGGFLITRAHLIANGNSNDVHSTNVDKFALANLLTFLIKKKRPRSGYFLLTYYEKLSFLFKYIIFYSIFYTHLT